MSRNGGNVFFWTKGGNMKNRLFAIDAVRGWVMIFMALDHAMYFCYVHISAEGFQGIRPEPMPDIAHYLTRFITHYCAPTFIFLAGLSVSLYTLSRRSHLSEGNDYEKIAHSWIFSYSIADNSGELGLES